MIPKEICDLFEDGQFERVAADLSALIVEKDHKLDYQTAQFLKLAVLAGNQLDYQMAIGYLDTFRKTLINIKKIYPPIFNLSFVMFECSLWSPYKYMMETILTNLHEDAKLNIPPSGDIRMMLCFADGVSFIQDIENIDELNIHEPVRLHSYLNAYRLLTQAVHYGYTCKTELIHIQGLAEKFLESIRKVLLESEDLQCIDPGLYYLGITNKDLDFGNALTAIKNIIPQKADYRIPEIPRLQSAGTIRIDKKIIHPTSEVSRIVLGD